MLAMAFLNSKSDSSMFVRLVDGNMFVVLVYVDDILIIGSNGVVIDKLTFDHHLKFALKDLGILHYFLVIEMGYGSNYLVFTCLNISI